MECMTTNQALKYLGISRGTFFRRIRDNELKPVNFNAALKVQHRPLWNIEDLNRLREISSSEVQPLLRGE